jgi:hypothetical protein
MVAFASATSNLTALLLRAALCSAADLNASSLEAMIMPPEQSSSEQEKEVCQVDLGGYRASALPAGPSPAIITG